MIRLATISDIQCITAIYNASIDSRMSTADTEPVLQIDMENWFYGHHTQRPIFVKEMANKVIAWLSFKDFYGRPAYKETAELSIYIDVNYQGCGIGTELVEYAIVHAKKVQITSLLAYVFSHNVASVKLFEKCGFAVWGQLPSVAKMDDKLFDLTILGLKLD